jgi:hypothetical protein
MTDFVNAGKYWTCKRNSVKRIKRADFNKCKLSCIEDDTCKSFMYNGRYRKCHLVTKDHTEVCRKKRPPWYARRWYVDHSHRQKHTSMNVKNTSVRGCLYNDADNYNPDATIDDGSCIFTISTTTPDGCTYNNATNFDPNASVDDGSCIFTIPAAPDGCTYANATNFDLKASVDDGSCIFLTPNGCTYNSAANYNPNATMDDGSCIFLTPNGCTYNSATNYNPNATMDDGSCIFLTSAPTPMQSSAVNAPTPMQSSAVNGTVNAPTPM